MKKKTKKTFKWLEEQCSKYGIDPSWYDSRRELYQVINYYTSGSKARRRRQSAMKQQNAKTRQQPILDKNGESNLIKHKKDTWMWD